jgi:hypothetical protein
MSKSAFWAAVLAGVLPALALMLWAGFSYRGGWQP